MGCLEALKPEVILSQASFKEAREYIKKNVREYHEVEPGYKIHDVHIIGVPPLYVGIEGENLIFPYTKPCHGTFVVKVAGGEEIARLRARKGK
ncbi:DUF1894 domain-containing protein [Methanoculleus horonobensis]|jgi:hypothetical protein|uniref:DUF1894 domain-containing protein n=1 Tax=Methanoculleus horonobensis TaxID=528314 RepID=UPI0008353AE7|nr:DUF1894 domain-containing protein [Methanoculleus horonobensis]MDD3069589.1 DUF1894 domain-containing protein [Methanoculleus horonobensis]